MMLGTREHFGIECNIRSSDGRTIIGDLWLWAGGLRIGDEISGVDLPLILDNLSGPLLLQGHRHVTLFDSLSGEDIVDCFIRLIYTEEAIPGQFANLGFRFYRYLVISAYNLEGFDSVFLLLIGCQGGRDRFIWKYKKTRTVNEFILRPGEYDTCILSCFDWLGEKTGYRSAMRVWFSLPEARKEELRRAVLKQRPELAVQNCRELLDQAAIEELNQRQM